MISCVTFLDCSVVCPTQASAPGTTTCGVCCCTQQEADDQVEAICVLPGRIARPRHFQRSSLRPALVDRVIRAGAEFGVADPRCRPALRVPKF